MSIEFSHLDTEESVSTGEAIRRIGLYYSTGRGWLAGKRTAEDCSFGSKGCVASIPSRSRGFPRRSRPLPIIAAVAISPKRPQSDSPVQLALLPALGRMLFFTVVATIALVGWTFPAIAQQRSPASFLRIEAEVAGTPLVEGEQTLVKLAASEPTRITISASNSGPVPLEVTGLRFEGKVLGIPVFRCDVIAPFLVQPGETARRTLEIEPACLKDQATGLVPSSLMVHGPGREPLARYALVLDVKGKLTSIYGITGVFVVLITLVSLLNLLAALVRQRLPRNRFSRALRFTTVGIGVGFSLVFVLATAAVLVPDAENWIPVVVIPTILFTAGGYLTPTPQRPAETDEQAVAGLQPLAEQPTQMLPQTPSPQSPTVQMPGAYNAGSAPPPGPLQGTTYERGEALPPPTVPTKRVRPVGSDPTPALPETPQSSGEPGERDEAK
jgi:hypothetical protein